MLRAGIMVFSLLGILTVPAWIPAAPEQSVHLPARRIVAYFPEWAVYRRNYHVANIPADKITHVNYAFAKPTADGDCVLFDAYAAIDKAYPGDKWDQGVLRGSFNQLQILKKKHPHLKTLISVGGWTLSGPFSDIAFTEEKRVKFAKACVAFMVKYGFDGVDIDWEYPVSGGLETNKKRPRGQEKLHSAADGAAESTRCPRHRGQEEVPADDRCSRRTEDHRQSRSREDSPTPRLDQPDDL